MEEALQFSTRCDCVADGSSARRPGTDGAPRGHSTLQALHRQQGSKDGPPEWACPDLGQLPPGAQPAAEGRPRLEGTEPHPGRSAKARGPCLLGGLRGRPHVSWELCLRLCLSRGGGGLPAAGRAPGIARKGDPDPHCCWSAAHLLSQGVLAEQAGHRREPTDPLAAWPKVTETTHESQKFVQTHPPPSLGGQEGSRPGRRVLRTVRADGCYRVSMKARGRARGPGGCLRGS